LLLEQDFTVDNLVAQVTHQAQNFEIIHLATHGEFRSGTLENSYIQFSDRRVSLFEFRQLIEQFGWDLIEQAPELLVLSACRTAVGDDSAELGFAGLAVQSGAKSALASLWYVSDLGTLALMSEFYTILRSNPIKSQALRQAQLNLLTQRTRIEAGQMLLSTGETITLPPTLALLGEVNLANPYYWSGFKLIGSWK
jgi:CHAT domain-containing protein